MENLDFVSNVLLLASMMVFVFSAVGVAALIAKTLEYFKILRFEND